MRGRQDAEPGEGAESPLLKAWERLTCAIVALLLLVLAVWLFSEPPDRRTALTGCGAADVQQCVVTVDAQSGSLTTALVAAAGVLALVAVLGRRFSSVKLPGLGRLSMASTATEVRSETPAAEAAAGRATPVPRPSGAGAGTGPALWDVLPPWAHVALYQWGAENAIFDIPVSEAIAEAYEPRGDTDLPWYVALRDERGHERTLRIAPIIA